MKRKLRTHLDLAKPDISQRVKPKWFQQTLVNSEERRVAVGDPVLVRSWGSGPNWLSGKVVGFWGHVNLEIQTSQGIVHHNVDRIKLAELP